jgi:hypothetical protein
MEVIKSPSPDTAIDASPAIAQANDLTSTQAGESAPSRPNVVNESNKSAENESGRKLNTIEGDELNSFFARLRAVESKIGLVDTMYGLHKSTTEAFDQKASIVGRAEHQSNMIRSIEYSEEYDFLKDAMFFMSRIRESYARLAAIRDVNARSREEMDAKFLSETDTIRETSSKAFLSGKRARILQVEWDYFINSALAPSASLLFPIEVVTGEPDIRLISHLGTSNSRITAPEGAERMPPTGADGIFQPLPERIRIRSTSVMAIMKDFKTSVSTRPGSSIIVLLRPFQTLVYNQDRLREHLAHLEDRYQNFGSDSREPPSLSPVVEDVASQQRHIVHRTGPNSATTLIANDQKKPEMGSEKDRTSEAHREEIAESEKKETDDARYSITALLHLRCLMEFVDSEIVPKEKYFRGDTCTHVHFHDLWHLFKPGDELIDCHQKQAYVVLRVQVPVHRLVYPWANRNTKPPPKPNASDSGSDDEDDEDEDEDDGSPFVLHCAYIDFDGKTFGPVPKRFSIRPFGDRKAIKSLSVYPFRFVEGPQVRERLLERGRKLLDVTKFKAMYYMGETIDSRDEVDSQVVIDFNEALADQGRRKAWEPLIRPISTVARFRGNPCASMCCFGKNVLVGDGVDNISTEEYCKSLLPKNSLQARSLILSPRSLEETLESLEELTETELLIMTYRVFGFVLRSRKWAQLDLTFLHYENVNAQGRKVDAFHRLELPDGHREMVKSLVVQHFRSKRSVLARDEPTDLIQGKGKGLIMLLHGAPGVGKTTTAEGISELFKKPLFQITCGDLGTTAKEVEAELEKNFALASRWDCILLLDEADVFLSARERTDFQRNGLVSVFLRVLEYYTGILFLTTNRLGDFDEAFASRIHMSLHYPELDKDKTLKVFQLNLTLIEERFKKHGRNIIFDASSVSDFADQHYELYKHSRWNGRQIRNACQTALALAEYDAQGESLDNDSEMNKDVVVRLELKYFKIVQKAYLAFGKYLGDIQGTKGDRRAYDNRLRAREGTPYAAKPGLFSPREDGQFNTGQSMSSQYGRSQSDMSGASQQMYSQTEDPYNQSYAPGGLSPGRQQSQGQYPMYAQPQQQQHQGYTQQQPRGYGQPQHQVYEGQQMRGFEAPPMAPTQRQPVERLPESFQTPQQDRVNPQFVQGPFRGQYDSAPGGTPGLDNANL